jgi:hypothetical protein
MSDAWDPDGTHWHRAPTIQLVSRAAAKRTMGGDEGIVRVGGTDRETLDVAVA